MRPAKRALVPLLALVLLSAAGAAAAQADARSFLKKRHDSLLSILRRPAKSVESRERRNAELDRLVGALLDFEQLSRKSLSAHWDGLNDSQRAEFSSLLKQLVQKSYRKNLESTLDYSIRYLSEKPDKEGVVVHTVARSRKKRRAPEIVIDYVLVKSDEGWKVLDVTTDGVSLVENYRNQFNRIIKRNGWDELLKRMRKRLGSSADTL